MGTPPDDSRSDISSSWGTHMRNGAFWMIALRWAIRLTGLVSTVILARILTPGDFGIVAMAMIVVGALEIFNQSGQLLVLIRLQNPTQAHYNSAWTVSFMIGIGISITILLVAPFTVAYFHEPRVVPVMQCLALRAFMGGLENVGTIDFRRDLRFNRFFAFNVYPKAISFVLMLTMALIWRDYWALVVGILTGQFVRVVLSYTMHPHRPRFTLSAAGDIWSFSIWTFIRTIGTYLNSQVDQIAVGGISGSATMGRYSVASDVAASPTSEINEPMVAVIYPVMSRLLNDKQALSDVYMNTLAWSAAICISAGTGVALVADDMVDLVLGAKWTGIGPLVAWLAISAGISGLSSGSYALFDALGKPHVGARMIWTRTFILAALVIPVAFMTKSLIDVAIFRTFAAVVFLPGLYIVVGRLLGITTMDYINRLWRPVVAASCMAGLVLAFNYLTALHGNVRLFADIFLGGATFVSVSLWLWTLSGRPAGPEADFLGTVRGYLPV